MKDTLTKSKLNLEAKCVLSTSHFRPSLQIIGNMYSLTDQKDLAPYLETILPGLKTALLDPVPEVRTVASRALGAMAKGEFCTQRRR